MLWTIIGVLVCVTGIILSIGLHEAGHMYAAKHYGVKVRRFFIGFGKPVVSFRRGGTEYGVGWIPAGGFCDIVGLTGPTKDNLSDDEKRRQMWSKPLYQRVVIMSAGIFVNCILAIIITATTAWTVGVVDKNPDLSPVVATMNCVQDSPQDGKTVDPCAGMGPAYAAGMRPGDRILKIDGHQVYSFDDVRNVVMDSADQRLDVVVERDGVRKVLSVSPEPVVRPRTDGSYVTVGAIGVTAENPYRDQRRGFVDGLAFTGEYMSTVTIAGVKGIISLPTKIPDVIKSLSGQERELDSPVSVVGVADAGGQLAERKMWSPLLLLLANLNIFLAVFNMIPLLPLDGGHIMVSLWAKIRSYFKTRRGVDHASEADQYAIVNYQAWSVPALCMIALLGAMAVLVVAADVVNPVQLF